MNCPKCGKDVGESKFCPECGKKIKAVDTSMKSKGATTEPMPTKNVKEKSIKGLVVVGILFAITVIITCVLIFAPGFAKTDEISFSTLYSDFENNAAIANKKYNGKKFVFYFTPLQIKSSGECKGTVCDSRGVPWRYIKYGNGADTYYAIPEHYSLDGYESYDFIIKLGKDAKDIEKNVTYKIIAKLNIDYHPDYIYDYIHSLENVKIIERNANIDILYDLAML